MAAAVKKFVDHEGKGHLPLPGFVPDIHSKPDAYMKFRDAFHAKAQQDVAAVQAHLHTILKSAGFPETLISNDELTHFCQHINVAAVFNYKPVHHDYDPNKIDKDALQSEIYDDQGLWYLAFRAAGRFRADHGRLPGERNDDPQADYEKLREYANDLLKDHEIEAETLDDKFLKEMCRFGNSQLHNIGAIIGGVVAQEVIKFVTRKWQPFNNIWVFNGITGESKIMRL